MQRIVQIKGIVQHYSWGGKQFLPGVFHMENPGQKPMAEYWLGAHPNHPSPAGDADLLQLIQSNPAAYLGQAEPFGALPYLLKVLDVEEMLSIQVHPSKENAQKGFDEEEARGISLTAPNRNYRDRNHKPEMMVALSDFWLLHGFRPEASMEQILSQVPELNFLLPFFERSGYEGLYKEVMTMDQQAVDQALRPLLERIIPHYKKNQLQKDAPEFWAARAAGIYGADNNIDRGIFSIFLFNLVHLKEDEGIFQDQGLPHAYLEGRNVEVMANSDNVLRAGLTPKHVDVNELMKHIRFEATHPEILNPTEHGHRIFHTPAKEFELHQYELSDAAVTIPVKAGEIWLLLEGQATVQACEEEIRIHAGDAVYVVPGGPVQLMAHESINLFRVTVPGS